jgi:hypothetical protein
VIQAAAAPVLAGVTMSAIVAWNDWLLYKNAKKSIEQIMFLYRTTNKIRSRTQYVAQLMRSIEKLMTIMSSDPVLAQAEFTIPLQNLFNREKISHQIKQLQELLRTSTFKGNANILYFRGRVLLAHRLITQIKAQLEDALHAIGRIDGYYSIATFWRKCQQEGLPCSFVKLTDGPSHLSVENGWIPLLAHDTAITNSFALGTPGDANKILVTGPNGCGKSTLLKAMGHLIVMGQSWGIVPATHVEMTLFKEVRTCLVAHEDIAKGLSTFMAEDQRMQIIQKFVESSQGQQSLLLIDEPWRGTVDAASAQYIYQFGRRVATYPQLFVMLATHVEKPISLAKDTGGIFTNKSVEIVETKAGGFKRTFKLVDGPADWWFNDDDRRSRFIDWLKTLYLYENNHTRLAATN